MQRILLILLVLAVLPACGPSYRWVNAEFTPEEMEDRFVMDKGACIREADQTYPDPYPVEDPDERYLECMANTTRREVYQVENAEGETETRMVTRQGDPYLCRPRRDEVEAYRDYVDQLRRQRTSRAQHINSCLRLMGWEQVPVEAQ